MVKHIVSWKIKDNAEGRSKSENAAIAKEKLVALKEKIKELKHIEVGINAAQAPADNWDLILITEFSSFADLDIYAKHPDHVEVAIFIGQIRETRACVDFEF